MINSICVVGGLGNMGQKHFNKLKKRYKGCSGGQHRIKFYSYDVEEFDKNESLSKYDALIIATPSNTHYEIAKAAIERGQHVLLEKPVTLSYQQAQTLLRLSHEYGVVYCSGHTMRYNPEFRTALPKLYHCEELDFKMYVPHKNIIENVTFDLLVHGFELAFNLGQREFTRDFELIQCNKGEDIIFVEAQIGSKKCQFTAGYNFEQDHRSLTAFGFMGTIEAQVDFHASDGKTPDALSNLHNHFLKLINVGAWTDQAEAATASIQLCEQVQEFIFPSMV